MPKWTHIMVHHTVTGPEAKVADIDAMHRARGFDCIGYHFLVERGPGDHGILKAGRPTSRSGAHCDVDGWNSKAIGISVVGTFHPGEPHSERLTTDRPLYQDIVGAICHLCNKYGIPADHVLGHRDVKQTACPGDWFPLVQLKADVIARMIAKE